MAADLSPRQREVAELVARGYSDKKIARDLGCSPETVAQHIRDAAARIPGAWKPRQKLLIFILVPDAIPSDDSDAA